MMQCYNYELGKQRALSVKNALVSRGIDDKNIKTVSYGEEKPAVSTNIWDKRAQNRRAVVEIIQVKNLNDDSQKDIHLYPQNYLP